MKCAGVAGGGDELLLGSCWLDSKLEPSSPPSTCHELIDSLLAPPPLAELKPLPPFTGYTGHLSINGISGHHFHAIAQRLPEENNNYPTQSGYGGDNDVVSSSTCAADAEPPDLEDVKPFLEAPDTKPFAETTASGAADSCAASCSPPAKLFDENHKQDMYDISSIEDIAAIIGSAIADTTVPSQPEPDDRNDSRDSWMDIDAWIASACGQHGDKIVQQDLTEFGLPGSPPSQNHHPSLEFSKPGQDFVKSQEFLQKNLQAGSTLQSLLTHGYMPLLQNRLQNGPPVKQEAPSSTSYGMEVISTSSPPGNAVSTTDGVGSILNGRYASHYALSLKPDGLCSPERLLGYPHAHTTTVTPVSKSKRNRSKPKQSSLHGNSLPFPSATAAELSGLLGKEKPVHRCGICNRGFLNKSNIKVHLRTHTGEKPFRCDVCAKAFRQKAHLIKHQQIHKRIGRD
ncbi:ichor [Plodia interpunctella]|uniref:ichor n=1 Tax=Plodia interpunctella TaxID=58824 RepID=UPI002367F2A3|nr:ichor [Plodia interpunctella]XP_053601455.1 ichor [Plodia interpunctella]XP_053601456.1 ichor [Plodia interpunctella]XP_053601457.1 ichor [Plodia interpunctella]XP_053601458.1 ichor [Plodia interpunctella]XP_053601459.1 ichor [Plodia interpunctella]XP_053601460.1 ichor [Plodia interpunctella]XP_053601461.1 ichor [Plodia interpunctella]XP_053601462.1 ichor [Plodia interpunctella]XP_053601463.1 ichor [Plodia interpunctella]XP_053601464.1 ichor [Plodia interpunctella]